MKLSKFIKSVVLDMQIQMSSGKIEIDLTDWIDGDDSTPFKDIRQCTVCLGGSYLLSVAKRQTNYHEFSASHTGKADRLDEIRIGICPQFSGGYRINRKTRNEFHLTFKNISQDNYEIMGFDEFCEEILKRAEFLEKRGY